MWPQDLLAKFDVRRVRQRGTVHDVICPVHETHESTPSCSIKVDDVRAAINCTVCCVKMGRLEFWHKVLQATETTSQDWYADGNQKKGRRPVSTTIEDTYSYRDIRGAEAFQIVRQRDAAGKKGFRARCPDEGHTPDKPKWKWSHPSITEESPNLYLLPEWINKPDQPLFICEGERDAETLGHCGFCATTNPFGASNWEWSQTKFVLGRKIVIVQDNDEPDQARTAMIAGSLIALGQKAFRIVTFPKLPLHGDVTDFILAAVGSNKTGYFPIDLVINNDGLKQLARKTFTRHVVETSALWKVEAVDVNGPK